jgi:hypothetical protein
MDTRVLLGSAIIPQSGQYAPLARGAYTSPSGPYGQPTPYTSRLDYVHESLGPLGSIVSPPRNTIFSNKNWHIGP